MSAEANSFAESNNETVRLCLLPTARYQEIANLLNHLSQCRSYRVLLDVGAVSHLGTVEFRVLGTFATGFRRHGGFLKLENVSAKLATLVRDFDFTDLLPAPPSERLSGEVSTRVTK